MGMAHILDSQRAKGLKPLSARYVDGRAMAGQEALSDGMREHGWGWHDVPVKFPPYWQYAALDPVLTCWLHAEFWPKVQAEYRGVYDLEMAATRVAAQMEETGCRVDLDYSRKKSAELHGYANAARDYLNDAYGLDNPTPMRLVRFFRENDIPMLDATTPTGAQKMDKEVLQAIDHEVARTVLAVRKAEKLAGTYLDNFALAADADDRIHPNVFTMGARTGRMSITDPALQTLPRKDPTVRDAFLPSDDDHVLVSCDYSQIEARLMAHFSRDEGLIAAFTGEEDFFCSVASTLFSRRVEKHDPERSLIKGVVYGKLYGAGVPKMALTAGVDVTQMRSVNDLFDNRYSGVASMADQVIGAGKKRKLAEGRGYVVTPYGRRLYAEEGKEYTLVNFLLQGHAAEILKAKMAQLDAALPRDVRMLLPIHDEILFDVPKETLPEVRRVVEKTMSADDYNVPITVESEIMPQRWGQKYRQCDCGEKHTQADHWERFM